MAMQTSLFAAAEACLRSDRVDDKLQRAGRLREAFEAGQLSIKAPNDKPGLRDAGHPPRPELVPPSQLAHRRIGNPEGQAALIHAVAHIEFNAINLACDAVYRFRDLPRAYYADWVKIAAEEAYHFSLLQDRLQALGYAYGDFPAHNGLWEMAKKTAGSCLERMALVPRVLEARGLDVTPGMIERLSAAGDDRTVAAFEVILDEEVRHVEIGTRWFRYLCEARGLAPEATFAQLLEQYMKGQVKPPFHYQAREQAGFSRNEMACLEGMAARHTEAD